MERRTEDMMPTALRGVRQAFFNVRSWLSAARGSFSNRSSAAFNFTIRPLFCTRRGHWAYIKQFRIAAREGAVRRKKSPAGTAELFGARLNLANLFHDKQRTLRRAAAHSIEGYAREDSSTATFPVVNTNPKSEILIRIHIRLRDRPLESG